MNAKYDLVRGLRVHPLVEAWAAYQNMCDLLGLPANSKHAQQHILVKAIYEFWCCEARKTIIFTRSTQDCYGIVEFFPEKTAAILELYSHWARLAMTVDELATPWTHIKDAETAQWLTIDNALVKYREIFDRLKVIATTTKIADEAMTFIYKRLGDNHLMRDWLDEMYKLCDAVALQEIKKVTTAAQVCELVKHIPDDNPHYDTSLLSKARSKVRSIWIEIWEREAAAITNDPAAAKAHLRIAPGYRDCDRTKARLEKIWESK